MSKIVKYCIYGAVERYIAVKIGKITKNIQFTGGSLDSAGVQPAVFTTKSEIEQRLVENHPDFKKGVIKILDTIVIDEAPAMESTAVHEVTSLQQARQYLMDKMGVSMERMQSKAKVLEVAKEKGVAFPNL